MSVLSTYFKLGSVLLATFSNSKTPVYTCNGQVVTDNATNSDYTIVKCVGLHSSQTIILPSRAGNYTYIHNGTTNPVNCANQGGSTISIAAGESNILFFDGSVYRKITVSSGSADFDMLDYPSITSVPDTSYFVVETAAGVLNKITWANLQTLLNNTGSYDYIISSIADLKTACSWVSGTTLVPPAGSYLFFGLVDISGYTLNIGNSSVSFYALSDNNGITGCRIIINGTSTSYFSGITFKNTNTSHKLIEISNGNLLIDACEFDGGDCKLAIIPGTSSITISNSIFGLTSIASTNHITISGSSYSAPCELQLNDCKFYNSIKAIYATTTEILNRPIITIRGCRFTDIVSQCLALQNIDTLTIESCNVSGTSDFIASLGGKFIICGDNIGSINVINSYFYPTLPVSFLSTAFVYITLQNNSVTTDYLVIDSSARRDEKIPLLSKSLRKISNLNISSNFYIENYDLSCTSGVDDVETIDNAIVNTGKLLTGNFCTAKGNAGSFTATKNTTNLGITTNFSNPVIKAKQNIVLAINSGVSSITFTPFKVEDTDGDFGFYQGILRMHWYPRAAGGGAYAPAYQEIPFIYNYDTGFAIAVTGTASGAGLQYAAPLQQNDPGVLTTKVWSGGEFNHMKLGKGLVTTTSSVDQIITSCSTAYVSSGVHSVKFTFAALGVATNLCMEFDYFIITPYTT
jgi:prepilin-type processing-associated H-X9-DG protein